MATADRDMQIEEGQACLGCKRKREDIAGTEVYALVRKVKLMAAAIAIMCAVTLIACGSSVIMYFKMNALRTEMTSRYRSQDSGDYYYKDPEYLTGDTFGSYETQSKESEDMQDDTPSKSKLTKGSSSELGCTRNKQARAACRCCVREVRSLLESGKLEAPAKIPESTILQQQHLVAAAHYTTTIDNEYIKSVFSTSDNSGISGKCTFVQEWNGQFCSNRTFSTPDSPITLKMFTEPDWMNTTIKLFDLKEDGSFVARYTGIYLLYAHVLFFDKMSKQVLGLSHESGGRLIKHFRCIGSLNYVDQDVQFGQNERQKYCSVNEVLFMNKGDVIKVQSLYSNTEIDISKDNAYFSGFLFSVK